MVAKKLFIGTEDEGRAALQQQQPHQPTTAIQQVLQEGGVLEEHGAC